MAAARKKRNIIAETAVQIPPPQPASDKFMPPEGIARFISYILSINPVLGFIIGMIFSSQPNEESRKFGKICYILAAVGLISVFFFILISFIMGMSGSDQPTGFSESYY